jgi:site-specific DNA recombinase
MIGALAMKNKVLNTIYHAVMYLRLSDEDGDSRESDSISNQRILNNSYLSGKSDIVLEKECVDDGFTGTNFNRPGFKEMMKLIEDGVVNCIIVKDLSRFGRDFSGVLQYVERILPKMGVRLILVNDNYDSIEPNHDFITLRLKSFINDIYPADTSRSVRSNLRAKMIHGQCVAPFAFYGYLKSPEDKHTLVVDQIAGPVVRDIVHLKLKGYSLEDIARSLTLRGIFPPLAYKRIFLNEKLKTGFCTNGSNTWDANMVRRILLDERYTGVLIQGKRTTPNHKVKKVIHRPEEEWIRFEDAFEPLIDRHTFEVIQGLMNRDMRKSRDGRLALLSGLVECGDCHQSMIRKSPNGKNYYYVCSTSLYEKECRPHSISEKKLEEAVKQSILHYISVIVELSEVLHYVHTASLPKQKMLEADRQMKVLEQECERILQIKVNLYNSFCEGLLDEEEFKTYKCRYDASLKQTEEAIKRQQAEIGDIQSSLEKQQEWMRHFLEYQDAEEIDRIMLSLLVKRIRIYSGKQIEVEFWFGDEFERLLSLLATVNKVQPNMELNGLLQRKGEIISA